MQNSITINSSDVIRFMFGDIVYLVANPDKKGMVTSYLISPSEVRYCVIWSDCSSNYHYAIELTNEKPSPI